MHLVCLVSKNDIKHSRAGKHVSFSVSSKGIYLTTETFLLKTGDLIRHTALCIAAWRGQHCQGDILYGQ